MHILYKTLVRPEECASLDKAARRRFVSARPEGEPQSGKTSGSLIRDARKVTSDLVESAIEGVPDDITCMDLDAKSKLVVESLNDDDFVIVYAPVREFALTNGPEDSFLCKLMSWACLDDPARRSASINKVDERAKAKPPRDTVLSH